MPGYAKEFLPNGSEEQQKEFERRVREMGSDMSELSAAMLVAKEMREEKAEGGRIGFAAGKVVMTLAEAIARLTKGYMKVTGKKPEGLDALKIKMEAAQKVKDANKVVDIQGNVIDARKPIMGGTQEFKSGIMRATGSKPSVVQTEEEILKKLKDQNKDAIKAFESKNPKDKKADGGRIGFKDGSLTKLKKKYKGSTLEAILENPKLIGAELGYEGIAELMNVLSSSGLFADGGRAGFYTGGITDVEPSLDDIGHGSDALMARTRLMSPGSQATTSTGLNYLLAEDNDNMRVPFKDGGMDRRKFMKMMAGIASVLPFGIGKIGKVAKVAEPAIKKAAELSGPALDKIIETVMSGGKLISQSGKRLKELTTKKKLKNVEVEEDIQDASYVIKKDGKEIYYKPSRMDEDGPSEEIIEVIEKITKKASGGIARMIGE